MSPLDRTRSDAGDGRNIDVDVAELSGEAAQQKADVRIPSEGAVDYDVASDPLAGAVRVGSAEGGIGFPIDTPHAPPRGYYDRPVLKEPVWMWAVPAYFVAGGAAGAASTVGAAAQFAGRDEFAGLIRACRRIATVGFATGTALLIYDLGRPGRFFNMLRVFRPSSPLNIGSWLLAGATPAAGVAAMSDGALGDLAGGAAGLLGLPITGYTAVLLANTAVPVWQEMGPSLPASFVASAAVSAASLLEMCALSDREATTVRTFAVGAKIAELITAAVTEKHARAVDEVGRALDAPRPRQLLRAARAAIVGAAAMSLLAGKSPTRRRIAGALGIVAATAHKFGVFYAGDPSTLDQEATFALQRARG